MTSGSGVSRGCLEPATARCSAPRRPHRVALATAGQGATYTITNLQEDDLPNGNCTLREALLAASTDSTHDLCLGDLDPDTIVLEAVGTYELDDGKRGGGLYVQASGAVALELHHLELARNEIDAPSFASGAGAWISLGSTGPFELSDARFDANEFVVAAPTNGPVGLNLAAPLLRARASSPCAGAASADLPPRV